MNIVALVGNVATDPEMRYTSGGTAIANFRLAVRKGKDETTFLTVKAWDKQAEIVQQYVYKGRQISVSGRLEVSAWETKAGEKRESVEVVANSVGLIGKKDDAPQRDPHVEAELAEIKDDDEDDFPY